MEDNYSLWERHDREAERWLSKRPVCYECDNHIQDDWLFEFDGELICGDCLMLNHQKLTENYIF